MKLILCILDGWGHSQEIDNNAIRQAAKVKSLYWDSLLQSYPNSLLDASGCSVGLPNGQPGNSEVGHMTIGAGRAIYQSLLRIDSAIADSSILNNKKLLNLVAAISYNKGAVHLMGLFSKGGVHAHSEHIIYLAQAMAAMGVAVKLHLFLDGRDTPPRSGLGLIEDLLSRIAGIEKIKLATICGRYYAMDRDYNWDRTLAAYNAVAKAMGVQIASANITDYLLSCYANDEFDEFIRPIVIDGYCGMDCSTDGVFFANFRKDRAVQLFGAITGVNFSGFGCCSGSDFDQHIDHTRALSMMHYSTDSSVAAIFDNEVVCNTVGEVLASCGLKQLRIAETEKYNHVTAFFNGGLDVKFPGEDRILVPSVKVKTYDLYPAMSAAHITSHIIEQIHNFDCIVVNYANPDMVGHTGNMEAAVQAVLTVDHELHLLAECVYRNNAVMLITSDHGNIECMFSSISRHIVTSHSVNPVPFVLFGRCFQNANITVRNGALYDIAPTILKILNLPKPVEMTGAALI